MLARQAAILSRPFPIWRDGRSPGQAGLFAAGSDSRLRPRERRQTERLIRDPRCAGLSESRLGEGKAGGVVKGASPPSFCGVSFSPESAGAEAPPIGKENAASEEPTIMTASISSMI